MQNILRLSFKKQSSNQEHKSIAQESPRLNWCYSSCLSMDPKFPLNILKTWSSVCGIREVVAPLRYVV